VLSFLASPWARALVLALTLVALLPGVTRLPPIDRDESRFAQATKQMLETRDFVRIRFQDEPRHKKPAGIHWLQAASVTLLSPAAKAIWTFRLPSLLGIVLAVAMVMAIGRRLYDPMTATAAGGLLGASVLAQVMGHQATTDAALLAAAVAAQGTLALAYVRQRRGELVRIGLVLGFWAAQGVALLLKGPVVPLVSLLTAVTLSVADKDWRWLKLLRPLIGLPIALAIASPWFIAVQLATDGGFVGEAVRNDLLPKLIGSQESHGAPPGYYLLLVGLTFVPGSLILWPALAEAWADRLDAPTRALLAWAIPAWLLFEAVPTKLPHYVLPMFPALALLCARLLVRTAAGETTKLDRWWAKLTALPWLVGILALAAAPAVAAYALDQRLDPLALMLGLAGFAGALAAVVLFALSRWQRRWQRRWLAATVVSAAIAWLVLPLGLGVVLPRQPALWLGRDAGDVVARHLPNLPPSGLASTGYAEPSLVFRTGAAIHLVEPATAARFLAEAPDRAVLVGRGEQETFLTALAAAGARGQALDTLAGFNYSKGRWTTLTLYRRAP
jgi:4-amino-4-deoxy-L-arabinose transferase-like glycosyltransferase